MKIDFHVHITPPDIAENWEKYAEKEPHFSLLYQGKCNSFAAAEDVIVAMEKEDAFFDKAVVFGFAFRDMGLCRYVNDYVIEKVKQYPEKLIGFSVVSLCGEAAKEIERGYSLGLKGVGELFLQEPDFENEKETAPITRTCKELGIPLLLHANEPVGHYYAGKTDVSLKQIEKFISNNQSLNVVLAHWGGGLLFYETMSEIREKFHNVYYDTAAMPFLYDERVYNVAKALGLCEKILFGSDFPLLPQSRYFDALKKSALSDEEKQLVLGQNARKLLKL